MSRFSLYLAAPPFMHVARLDGEPPPLGAILLVDLAAQPANAPDVWPLLDIAPWCPVCVLMGAPTHRRRLPRSNRVCAVTALEGGGGAASILAAVRLRPRPAPMELAEWLTGRTSAPALRAPLVTLFGRAIANRGFPLAGAGVLVNTPLRALGGWSALAWQEIARLADLAADREAMGRLLVRKNAAAAQALRAIDDLLGVSEDDFRERAGWEWVLESALRRSREAIAARRDSVVAAAVAVEGARPHRTVAETGRVPAAFLSKTTRPSAPAVRT